MSKGTRPDKNLNCGYVRTFNKSNGMHELRLHGNFLGSHKSVKACEIVKGIHEREEAIKKLKNKILEDKELYYQEYYKSLEKSK